jgi:LAS superfamily LD-carboxypeptidase LdcB
MKQIFTQQVFKQRLLLICLVQTALISPLSLSQAVAHEGEEHTPHSSTALHSSNNQSSTKISANTQVISRDFVMGKFNPKQQQNFVKIDTKDASRNGLYLQKEAYQAFKNMSTDAKKAGIALKIRSATRNFDYQKGIWERKWTGKTKVSGKNLAKTQPNLTQRAKTILRYSSMPGSSRHHWGTDIDLNSFENNWFSQGQGLKLYTWLKNNAANYGFCQVYTQKGTQRSTGYEEEKWHWSYRPLASQYTNFAKQQLRPEYFTGFKGANLAKDVKIVNDYILGINPICF